MTLVILAQGTRRSGSRHPSGRQRKERGTRGCSLKQPATSRAADDRHGRCGALKSASNAQCAIRHAESPEPGKNGGIEHDSIRDCAESLSSHLQSQRHTIAVHAADGLAFEVAMRRYPFWEQGYLAGSAGPGSSYEPEPAPPPPSGPAPATNSPPPLPPEEDDNPWSQLEAWQWQVEPPALAAAATPAPAAAATPAPAAAATPAPAVAATPAPAAAATPAPAAADPGGLTVKLPDLASATDDQLVATVGILTDQLHRVYREMQIRIQIRQNAPPPADLLA